MELHGNFQADGYHIFHLVELYASRGWNRGVTGGQQWGRALLLIACLSPHQEVSLLRSELSPFFFFSRSVGRYFHVRKKYCEQVSRPTFSFSGPQNSGRQHRMGFSKSPSVESLLCVLRVGCKTVVTMQQN